MSPHARSVIRFYFLSNIFIYYTHVAIHLRISCAKKKKKKHFSITQFDCFEVNIIDYITRMLCYIIIIEKNKLVGIRNQKKKLICVKSSKSLKNIILISPMSTPRHV